jgi:uncharacterized protein (DUF362 family)
MENKVFIKKINEYIEEDIYAALEDELFDKVKTAKKVVLKPNWVREFHREKPSDWDYIITHPSVVSAVINKTIELMPQGSKISIIDGPEFSASFEKILSYYPIQKWQEKALSKKIIMEILDLREEIWVDDGNVVIKRTKNQGDSRGNTQVNLTDKLSEFSSHRKSKKGYFGADSNIIETNNAHDGYNNLYRVSRTVIECDVFINLPKLKTHKKAGITCCLKNLVGINTYRNFLPHCSLGTTEEGGDQFFLSGIKQKIEGRFMPIIHQRILTIPFLSRCFSPFMSLGKRIFGNNKQTIRGGSWYGNDTMWRMILDINKVLLYSNPDGTLRQDDFENRKIYIGIVDAILCGEGNGPKIPDPKRLGYIIQGSNPATIDSVCATVMGFNPGKIPSIKNSFNINKYPITTTFQKDIEVLFDGLSYNLNNLPSSFIDPFIPTKGWVGNIER